MLGIIFARAFDLMRHHLAAFPFKASRLALYASIRAFHHGLLNKRLLHNAIQVSSAIHHFAISIAFGARLRPLGRELGRRL
jgi:hypothetical protein